MGHDWESLAGAVDGEVVLPGSRRYEEVRRPAIAGFDAIRPEAVVRCRTPSDVSEAIAFAGRSGLPVAARSGGHCFAGRSSTRGIVIDVGPMDSVSVADGVAAIGAGARLGGVYEALSARGLTIPAGCGDTVGIAGLALGGGLGVLGRRYGLTSDRLVGAELVLADGTVVTCDEARHGDLFWALRGAGAGRFGVVTSLAFAPVPDPPTTSFWLSWPATGAVAVAGAWQEWAPAAPDGVSASLLITAAGVHVYGAAGPDAAARLDELVVRAGVDPASSALRAHPSILGTKRELAGLGDRLHDEPPGRPYCRSEFFARPLPAGAMAGLVAHLQRDAAPGQVRELDLLPMGGAYNRVAAGATAFAHRGDRFLLKHGVSVGPDAPAGERAVARRWLAQSWRLTHPWGTGRAYQNFPDPDRPQWSQVYHGANHDRLLRVAHRYLPLGGDDHDPAAG